MIYMNNESTIFLDDGTKYIFNARVIEWPNPRLSFLFDLIPMTPAKRLVKVLGEPIRVGPLDQDPTNSWEYNPGHKRCRLYRSPDKKVLLWTEPGTLVPEIYVRTDLGYHEAFQAIDDFARLFAPTR